MKTFYNLKTFEKAYSKLREIAKEKFPNISLLPKYKDIKFQKKKKEQGFYNIPQINKGIVCRIIKMDSDKGLILEIESTPKEFFNFCIGKDPTAPFKEMCSKERRFL